jgi:hypothetical protein
MAEATDSTRTPAGQPPAAGSVDPIDPHPAWAAEAAALRALHGGLDDEEADRLSARIRDIQIRIVETPARTLAGAREQLAVADRLLGEPDEGPVGLDGRAVRNALATLDALAGRA